jgi:membrane protein DedA with SNARE-associated domain
MTPDESTALLQTWGYPAYLLFFVASAFGSPITEDMLLLAGGYLIGAGIFSWLPTAITAFVGVIAADTTTYAFGRKLRQHSLRRGMLRHLVRPGRLRIATRWFARYGDRMVFLSRLLPGTRMVVFLTAGVRGMPARRFVLYDGAATLIWVPLLLTVGEVLGERIGGVREALEWFGARLLWVAVALIAAFLLRQYWLGRGTKGPEPDVE